MKELGSIIANVLTDMPIGCTIGNQRLCLYPQTLGVMYITSQLIESLEIDKEHLSENPLLETMRLVKHKRHTCCRIIAYHLSKGKNEILDKQHIDALQNTIEETDDEDISTLLILILKDNSLEDILKHTGIKKELERMSKVSEAKDTKNQYIFGGMSIWGSLIDAACERYGWTFDYVVWEISYANLTLMMKDKVTSIYLSDNELRRCRVPQTSGDYIDGNNREAVMRAVRESEDNPE